MVILVKTVISILTSVYINPVRMEVHASTGQMGSAMTAFAPVDSQVQFVLLMWITACLILVIVASALIWLTTLNVTVLEALQEELVQVQYMCAVHSHAAMEGHASPPTPHINVFAPKVLLVLTVRWILIIVNHTAVKIMQHVLMA